MSPATLGGLALRSIRRRALRSLLTALTAAVAVATVFATRAILRGSEMQLERDLGRLGLRTVQALDGTGLVAMKGGGERMPVVPADLETTRAALAKAGVPAMVTGAWIGLGTAAAGKAPIPVPVIAAAPEYFLTFEAELEAGRVLEAKDARPGAEAVCVLDAETARVLGGLLPGAEVTVGTLRGGWKSRVVGVLADPFRIRASVHAPDLTASARSALTQIFAFRNVYVPIPPAGGAAGSLMVLAVAGRREDASKVLEAMESSLRAKERGLFIWSRGTWVRNVLEMAGQQIEIANIVWAIVLAVALVMIATVTLVGVRERTAEVAVRRAEGATRAQVVVQLLAEGALLALAGGIAGIPLGFLAAHLLSTMLTWRPYHSTEEGVMAVGLGVAVGILASALPALRASRWVVVEGLRRGA